jgi:hypothetical protein
MSTHPMAVRLVFWMVTAFLILFVYLASNTGFTRLVDYINDLFIIKG